MCLGAEDQWHHFDDDVAMPVPADRVLKNNAHAYMLFYERA
jgi:ubiquitin C-terminal hydrolase